MRFSIPRILLPLALLVFIGTEAIDTYPLGSPDGHYLSTLPRGLHSFLPVPPGNPLTPEKVELGRYLFFEPRLSQDGTVSCASCHDPATAYSDGRSLSLGIGGAEGRRNAPSLLNVAYRSPLFWDGRVKTLEEQILKVVTNPVEFGSTPEAAIRRLETSRFHRLLYQRAFGTEQITLKGVSQAIASFERTLLSGDSVYDRSRQAGNPWLLSVQAHDGLRLFRGRANCSFCHRGSLFSDNRFHNTGVGWAEEPLDWGRYEVTGREEDRGKFKTPSLRDVEYTAPYMHNGSIENLEDVVDFYDRGGGANPFLDGAIRPLRLKDSEKAALIAFLRSLSGNSWRKDEGLQ